MHRLRADSRRARGRRRARRRQLPDAEQFANSKGRAGRTWRPRRRSAAPTWPTPRNGSAPAPARSASRWRARRRACRGCRPCRRPIKLFDNLTYIGFNDVGAWVVPTSAGIILFDTLNSTADAMNVIEPEMQKAGFDPAQIKYILLGHGHADHFGGASYLQMKYHAKVLAAMPDWAAIQRGGRGTRAGHAPDMDVTDGQKLTLGDTTITLDPSAGPHAGHDRHGGAREVRRAHAHVAIMSGTQMPTQDSLDAFKHVFNDEVEEAEVESFLGSHPDI
jgi:metallo-beta-lactamase class B